MWAEKKEPGTHCLREQCVPGSLFSSPAREPGNEALSPCALISRRYVFFHFLHVLHAETCPAEVYFCLFLFSFVAVFFCCAVPLNVITVCVLTHSYVLMGSKRSSGIRIEYAKQRMGEVRNWSCF